MRQAGPGTRRQPFAGGWIRTIDDERSATVIEFLIHFEASRLEGCARTAARAELSFTDFFDVQDWEPHEPRTSFE